MSPAALSRSTRRRQAAALRLTLAASATFDSEASRCMARRMARSMRSSSGGVRNFVVFIGSFAD
ncbi:Uncharacterised protein [Mycobacterium tuberculosis]|nr:Uncharacterised protein [Mycobacterium tuberculosis]